MVFWAEDVTSTFPEPAAGGGACPQLCDRRRSDRRRGCRQRRGWPEPLRSTSTHTRRRLGAINRSISVRPVTLDVNRRFEPDVSQSYHNRPAHLARIAIRRGRVRSARVAAWPFLPRQWHTSSQFLEPVDDDLNGLNLLTVCLVRR